MPFLLPLERCLTYSVPSCAVSCVLRPTCSPLSRVRAVRRWCKNGVDFGGDGTFVPPLPAPYQTSSLCTFTPLISSFIPPAGSNALKAAKSCNTARAMGSTDDGRYWIRGNEDDGSLATTPFQAFCDMTSCGAWAAMMALGPPSHRTVYCHHPHL